jgi:ribose-phosphate pyrophosphokinase
MIAYNTKSAEHLTKGLKVRKGKLELKRFSDGEIYVVVKDDLKGKKADVVASLTARDESLLELIFILDALKRAKARINLVITYLCYARQDRTVRKGQALGSKIVCDMIKNYKPGKVSIIDVHNERIKKFLRFNNIILLELFAQRFKKKKDRVVVAPDKGAMKRAKAFAKMINADVAYLAKERLDHEVKISEIKDSVKGKNAIIIDDMIDTGSTIIKAVKLLKDKGCEDIYVIATHGVFSADAVKKLEKQKIKKIYVTDSILQKKKSKKIEIISIKNILKKLI